VVIPSNAYDAKGLMRAAVLDNNPVVFMFHKALQGMGWLGTVAGSVVAVPEQDFIVPIGKAAVVREGNDVTLVGWGLGVHHALDAASQLAAEGVDAEVVDLRTLAPLDRDTLGRSAEKTGRLIVIDDDYRHCGLAAEVIASVCEDSQVQLRAAPRRITFPDVPIPYAPEMERPLLPNARKVIEVVRAWK
jgi:pyruvate dehydrogenase E1 component beta subunit